MLGALILEYLRNVSSNRVLDSKKAKMENSVIASGKAKGGIQIIVTITYWNIQCDNRLFYGEGNGQITIIDDSDRGRDVVKVTEYGVGKAYGTTTMWRGSAFYQTTTSNNNNRFSFLHGVVGVFEYESEEHGTSKGKYGNGNKNKIKNI
jgi:hypothetical protein